MPIAPKITQKMVREGLRKEPWRLDYHNKAYVNRRTDVLGGSVTFAEQKHTGTKLVTYDASAYTGVPEQRWDSTNKDTLKEAVAWANERRQKAVDASAAELGENFLET